MCAVAFSAVATNVLADEEDGKEKTMVSLNPDAATDDYTHVVWQENLTGNMEIYFMNDVGIGNFEGVLREAIEELSNSPDKDSQKALENLNDALEKCLEQDYKHSIDKVHKAVKNLEKAENTELINTLVDAVGDFAKTNILYAEYDLTFNNSYIQESYQKYYLAIEKYDDGNFDACIKQFKNSYLKIVEGYEENDETYVGVDFGKIVRISYTNFDSVCPTVYLNGFISVSWVEVFENESHIMYARSTNNGLTWWYLDVNVHAAVYLNFRGIDLPSIPGFKDLPALGDLLGILREIKPQLGLINGEIAVGVSIIPGCHYLYGRVRRNGFGGWDFGVLPDPELNLFDSYSVIAVGGDRYYCAPEPPPGDGGVPLPKIDLKIMAISFSTTRPFNKALVGDTVSIIATAKNIGVGMFSGLIGSRFYAEGIELGDNSFTTSISPDGYIYFQWDWETTSEGIYDIQVFVDPENGIDEVLEDNNQLTDRFLILSLEGDYDSDGLTNLEELLNHLTDPISIDTDKDGLIDAYEILMSFTNPLSRDSDNDGLTDFVEITKYITNPNNPDSDGDGLLDGEEILDKIYGFYTDAMDPDNDDDGLSDREELTIYFTNPNNSDTDSDGLNDYAEVVTHNTNPHLYDTDTDLLSDGAEVMIYGSDPLNAYTDNDRLMDGLDVKFGASPTDEDTDDDGLWDDKEVFRYGTNPANPDTDNDELWDGYDVIVDDVLYKGELTVGTRPLNPDTDGDGMPDGWEVKYGLNPLYRGDAHDDSDADGLNNVEEHNYGTDPTNIDTDTDGLTDYQEVVNYNTNPVASDTDDDGLTDSEEIYGEAVIGGVTYTFPPTNPLVEDSDNDMLDDLEEITPGDDGYITNPNDGDTDNDGLGEYLEVNIYNTNPTLDDTDGDGLLDGEEVYTYGTIPTNTDSDEDTLSDYEEVFSGSDGYITNPRDPDSDNDGLNDGYEMSIGTNPTSSDSDGDGMPDGWEDQYPGLNPTVDDASNDCDDDDLLNSEEHTWGTDPTNSDTDGDGVSDGDEVHIYSTDPNDRDSDNDGLTDKEKVDYGTDPNSPDSDGDGLWDGYDITVDGVFYNGEMSANTDPLKYDSDGDGLNDYEEVITYLTDPWDVDYDNDGLKDGEEVHTYSTDPKDADSDNDGLSDWQEIWVTNTDPNDYDTDDDGLWDGNEVNTYNTNPNDVDTDDDGINDNIEVNGDYGYITDPTTQDSDGDILTDWEEIFETQTSPIDSDADNDGVSDAYDDEDGDGVSNIDELRSYNTDPQNPQTYYWSDAEYARFLDDVRSDDGCEFGDPPCPYPGGSMENVYIEYLEMTAPAGYSDPFNPVSYDYALTYGCYVYNDANKVFSITLKSYNNNDPTSIDTGDAFKEMVLKDSNDNILETNIKDWDIKYGQVTITTTSAQPTGSYKLFFRTAFDDDASTETSTLHISADIPISYVCPETHTGSYPCTIQFYNMNEAKDIFFRGRWLSGYVKDVVLDGITTISTTTANGKRLYVDSEFCFYLGYLTAGVHKITFTWQKTSESFGFYFHICTDGWKDPKTHDLDGDGLSDAFEADYDLNPGESDTDSDGIVDGDEDADGDGLTNLEEYNLGTDPTKDDTDGDNMPDGWEVSNGLNPLIDDAGDDLDSDDISNYHEYLLGSNPQKLSLFLQVDWVVGHEPTALAEVETELERLGIEVFIEKAATSIADPDTDGVNGISLDEADANENNRHTKHSGVYTAVYVLYGDICQEVPDAEGGANPRVGICIFDERGDEVADYLGISRKIVERRTLLHEIGHCIGIMREDPSAACLEPTCVMSASTEAYNSDSTYCATCWSEVDMSNVWNVD